MLLKKLEIKNYQNIQHGVIDFEVDASDSVVEETVASNATRYHLIAIIGSDFKEALDQLNKLFELFTLMVSPTLAATIIAQTFKKTTTTCFLRVEFNFENVQYQYELKINSTGVQKELLFADGYLKYNSLDTVRPTPRFPDGISSFFSKILCINLASSAMVTELVTDSISRCCHDDVFLSNVAMLLTKLQVTPRQLLLEAKASKVFIYDTAMDSYIDIREANNTIRVLFGLFSILFPSAVKRTLVVIANFGNIDLLKKITLMKFFRKVTLSGSKSQLIAIDYMDNKSYSLTGSGTTRLKTSNFVKDLDTNKYIFSEEEE